MKKIVFCSLFLTIFNVIIANQVSENDAYMIATNFINNKTETSSFLALKETKTVDNIIIYYRFQISDKGFIFISGSFRTTPVLAYSLEYDFIENPGINYFLERFEKEILAIEKRNSPPLSWVTERWNVLFSGTNDQQNRDGLAVVSPLLTTPWNQNRFYNTYCPWDVYAGAYYDYRVPNGCVALAMAMILNYYQYPTSGTGGVSYTPPGYPRQTVQFGQHSYNYNAMYEEPYTYNNEISKLTYHCGVAVKMHYDYTGSGATEVEARRQFIDIFKYNPTAALVGPAMFNNWGAELKRQLDNHYPLFYVGYNSMSGHAFVLDGYDVDTLFHVNWGWGGNGNGYFHITNLDPYGNNDGYNDLETTIFNLYPANNFPAHCAGHKTVTASCGYITNGSANQLYAPNSDCSWMIAVKDATNYIFEFSRLDTEEEEDFITIYNGPTPSSGIAGKYSGNTIPANGVIVNNVDSVLVTFTSNATVEKRGFVLRYRTIISNPYCGGTTTITSPEGTISDNSGDNDYKSETNCTWLIQPAYTGAISATFLDFDLQSGDFVDIYNNSYQPPMLVDRFDKFNIPSGWKTYNFAKMKVVFVADNWQNGGGFTFKWSATIVGIDDQKSIQDLSIYPNPTTDYLKISFKTTQNRDTKCTITDCTGKTLLTKILLPNQNSVEEIIALPNLSKGVYFIELQNFDTKIIRKFLIL